MSWSSALEGLVERLQSVDGLAYVQLGYPSSVNETPMAYVAFTGNPGLNSGEMRAERYTAVISVLVPWQDFEEAENELAPFVNSIRDAFFVRGVDDDGIKFGQLGGRVNMAKLGDGSGGFTTIGRNAAGAPVIYRSITWPVEITDK